MLIHAKKRERMRIESPLTSLIDIVFLLLVFFLLTTNYMVDEGIKIALPKADHAAMRNEQTLTVVIDKDGQVFCQDQLLSLTELPKRLAWELASRTDKTVVVKADRELRLDTAVRVMDIAKAAGAEKLALATERDS